MKKLLVLILVLVLGGCEKPTDTDTEPQDNEPQYVEVCYKGRNNLEWGCHLEKLEELE